MFPYFGPRTVSIEYQARKSDDRRLLDKWGIKSHWTAAEFLCRVMMREGLVVNVEPVALFNKTVWADDFVRVVGMPHLVDMGWGIPITWRVGATQPDPQLEGGHRRFATVEYRVYEVKDPKVLAQWSIQDPTAYFLGRYVQEDGQAVCPIHLVALFESQSAAQACARHCGFPSAFPFPG